VNTQHRGGTSLKIITKTALTAATLAAGVLAWAPMAHASDGYVVTVGSVTIEEGSAATASVPVSLSAPAPAGGLCLKVELGRPGDTALDENDFVAQAGQTVTIAEGGTSATILIPIVDDLEAEVQQSFSVAVTEVACVGVSALAGPVNTDSTGQVTVLDNDLLPSTGGSANLAWLGLGLLGLGAAGFVGSRRRTLSA
jgi:hypothetical protein